MIKTVKELIEERSLLIEELEVLVTKADAEKRELTKDEEKRYTEIEASLEDFKTKIKRAEDFELIQKMKAKKEFNSIQEKKEDRDLKRYSFLKVIRSLIPGMGESLDGIELEMSQEAKKEAKEAGVNMSGIGIPTLILRHKEKRDMSIVGGATHGVETVATEMGSLIEFLYSNSILNEMGARKMTGLQGNIQFPRVTSGSAGGWKGEITAADQSDPTFDDIDMTPHKLTTYVEYSRQLLIQSSIDIENFVRQDLMTKMALDVDAAGISGSGSAPTGILNTAGIGAVAIGDNGGAITREFIVNLLKEIKINNAHKGSLGFITNPYVECELLKTLVDAGSGKFVLENAGENLIGYKYMSSTQVPFNVTKGTSISKCSSLIFGNFADMAIGQWGPLEVIVNPYSLDTEGEVRITVISFWDILIRHAQSFAAIKDILTTYLSGV